MSTLAVQYRPQTFNDVVEQYIIVSILQEQIRTETHKNAYLFTGSAGTGKTTIARIFANELNNNKGNPIEIDAASNNGVDDVRKIIDQASFKSIDSKFKIFILDEVHMFSTSAWNAMLKLIEEPPSGTVFIFCTTDAQKIPNTILSRVQRFDFARITFDGITNRLRTILENENIEYENSAIKYIAKIADGGLRDAITMLDKCLSYSKEKLLEDDVINILGAVNYEQMFDFLGYLTEGKQFHFAIGFIDELHKTSVDLKQFIKQFIDFLLDCTTYYLTENFDYIKIPNLYQESLDYHVNYKSYENILNILDITLDLNSEIKWIASPKTLIQSTYLLYTEGLKK